MSIRAVGVQHIGIPVSDMERSLEFYQEILGLERVFVAEGEGPEVSEAVGVPDAHLKFAFLKAGNTIVELLQYLRPQGKPYDRMNCDIGACHLSFEVDDIEEAYQSLKADGIKFNAAPLHVEEGPLAGCAFAYFPDPDGFQLEIFETAD